MNTTHVDVSFHGIAKIELDRRVYPAQPGCHEFASTHITAYDTDGGRLSIRLFHGMNEDPLLDAFNELKGEVRVP